MRLLLSSGNSRPPLIFVFPNIDFNVWTEAPFSAARVAPALRSP